jgi:cytoskeletal protein RodZ
MIGWRSKTPTPAEDRPKGFDDFDLRLGDLMRGERATLGKSLLDVQRELKIKATYIAAIEHADISAFETPGFIAGYVRSYARYLGMEPEETFARFCREANFTPTHGMSSAASAPTLVAKRAQRAEAQDPFISGAFIPKGPSPLSQLEPGAIGSFAVLIVLIGALGYGGWSVLQEVQRVQLAPVNEAPSVVAELDPLGNVTGAAPLVRSAPAPTDTAAAGDPAADRLARPEALDVPVLVPRDGPIAAIRPDETGVIATAQAAAAPADPQAPVDPGSDVQVVADAAPSVEILAVRPSWVRVSGQDGTVLFEKILDAGERYVVPPLEQPPVLRAGNSGSVYFTVGGKTYGPAAPGAAVVKNLALSAENLTQTYALADLSGDKDLAHFVAVAEATQAAKPADAATGAGTTGN